MGIMEKKMENVTLGVLGVPFHNRAGFKAPKVFKREGRARAGGVGIWRVNAAHPF